MLMASAFAAPAVPQGGVVAQGQVAVSQSGNVMTVNQSTDKAIVNWQSFSIGADAKVNIVQPSASSTHLSRVTGNDPSVIQGQLNSNGQVVLVNPNGIVVGKDGSVSASSFTASTLNITDADFMAGKYQYARNGSKGEVVNQGKIETKAGGYVALLGAKVTNEGTITSQQGAVYLGAGDAVAVPVTGSGRIKFEVSPAAINTSVANNKDAVIVAESGQVYMRAASLNDLAVASVQQSGLVDVSGAQGGNVTVLADKGQIKVDGTIKANSSVAPKGGNIVMGHDLATGVLAAQGDYSGAKLEAGKGFVETSGEWIATTGTRVQAGEWLLDPANITISAGPASGTAYVPNYVAGADSVILASDIALNLNAGTNVTISTGLAGSAGTSDGNINVTAAIVKSGSNHSKLTLIANNSITVGARVGKTAIDTTSTGKLDIEMTAYGLAPNSLNSRGILLNNVLDANRGIVTLTGTSYNSSNTNGWGTANASNTGIVFNTNSGVYATSYTISGTANLPPPTDKVNLSGVSFVGTGVILSSTGSSRLSGWSNNVGNFAPGIYFAVASNTTIDAQSGSVVFAGQHATVESNGIRIGTAGEAPVHRLTVTTRGNVTISSQTPDGVLRGMMSYRTGNIRVASGTLTLSGEKVDFFDGTANLIANNGTTVNVLADKDLTLSKVWSGGEFRIDSNTNAPTFNFRSTSGPIEINRSINAGVGTVNLEAPSILLRDISINETVASNKTISARLTNITSDSLAVSALHKVTTAGTGNTLSIKTLNPANGIRLGASDSLGWLGLSQTELNNFTTSNLVIGDVASTGSIVASSVIATSNSIGALTLRTASDILINASLTVGAGSEGVKNLILQATGVNSVVSQSGALKAAGLSLIGSEAIYSLNHADNEFFLLTGNVESANIFNKNAFTIGTIGSSIGLQATGTVQLESNSNIIVDRLLKTTDTSQNAIFLNAGKNTSAGVSTGGNIIVNASGAIEAGANARITLMTGSVADSTGLGVPVGNSRYGSDELTTGYNTTTQALGAGKYAIYRERPVVELTLNPDSKTYDGIAYTGGNGYVVSTGDLKNGDTTAALRGTLIFSGDSQGAKNAGTYSIAGSGLSSDLGYALSYTSGTLTINKVILTSSLQANDKTYDGNQTATGTIDLSGFVNGETLGATASSILFDTKDAGTGKTVTASGIELDQSSTAANYQLATTSLTATTTATINKRILTLSGTTIDNKVYDATTVATINGIGSLNEVVSGETVGATANASFENANAGVGKVVTLNNVSLTGADSVNYTLATPSTTTASITKAPLALTLTDKSTTYGTVIPLSYSLTGFVNGETDASAGVSVVGLQTTGLTSASTTNNVGTYAINATGITAQNYAATSITPGALTINPATLTLTPNAASKFILTADPALTFSTSGFVNGDANSVLTAPSISRASGVDPGDYLISLSGGSAQNYVLDLKTNIFTIVPAFKVSILLEEVRTIYGTLGASSVTSVSYYDNNFNKIVDLSNTSSNLWTDPLGGGLEITPTLTGVTINSNVGTYSNAVNATHSGTTLSKGNFTDVMVVPSNYIVDKKILTITADSLQRVYDGSTFTSANANFSSNGFVLGQNISSLGGIAYSGGAMNTRNVGTYGIEAMLADPANAAASNYDIRYVSGQLVTTPRPITINGLTIDAKEYDGTTSATANLSNVTFGDFISGDNVNLNTPTATFDNADAGTAKVVTLANQSISGADAANYTLINNGIGPSLTYSGDIIPKVLSVSGVTASNKVYDSNFNATLNTAGMVLNGVLSADASAVSVSTSNLTGLFENKNVGSSNIVGITGFGLSGAMADNYSLPTNYRTTTTAAITPRTLNVTATQELSLVYNGTIQNQASVIDGLQGQDQVLISGLVSQRDAGNYVSNLSVTGDTIGNYAPVLTNASFNIAKANASVLVNSATETYNASTQSINGFTTVGVFAGDTLSVNGDQISGRDAGTYISSATASHNNYNLTVQQGSLVIDPAPLLVIANAGAGLVYNGQTQTQTATIQGVLGGDDILVAGLVSARDAGNYSSNLSVGGTALGNYTPTLIDASFNIDKANASVLVNSATETYNASTQSINGFTTVGVFAGDTLSVTGDQISGRDAGTYLSSATASHNNYILTVQQGRLTINPAPLSVSGVTAKDKVADGTTYADLVLSGAQFEGLMGGDRLALGGAGRFDSPDVGMNKSVLLSLNVSGESMGNYLIKMQESTKASILVADQSTSNPDSGSVVNPETQKPNPSNVTNIGFLSPTQRMLASLDLTQPAQIELVSSIQDGSANLVFTLAAEIQQMTDCSLETSIQTGELKGCECAQPSNIRIDKDEPEICYVPARQLVELSMTK